MTCSGWYGWSTSIHDTVDFRDGRQATVVTLSGILAVLGGEEGKEIRQILADFLFSLMKLRILILHENRKPCQFQHPVRTSCLELFIKIDRLTVLQILRWSRDAIKKQKINWLKISDVLIILRAHTRIQHLWDMRTHQIIRILAPCIHLVS